MKRHLPLLAALVIVAGCEASRVVPVSGHLTLDGKPLSGVHVSFQPIAARGQQEPGGGSYAISDASGKYELRMVEDDRPGAVVGKHRIEITARSQVPDNVDLPARPPPKVVVPEKYNRKSELTIDVPPGGTPTANFELKSQ